MARWNVHGDVNDFLMRAGGLKTVAAFELAEALGELVLVAEVTRLGIIIVSMLSGLIR